MQKISTLVLLLLLAVAGAAWWRTAPPTAKATKQRAAALAEAELVDQSTYATAERLARLAETAEERSYAQTALRVADHALAFAFTTALRDVEAHPPVLNAGAQKIQDRIHRTQGLLDSDQLLVAQLTGALAQAKETQKDALQDELDLAQSQLELDKDELEEASQDLIEAGGNPQRRIEELQQEHDALVKARLAPTPAAPAAIQRQGSWNRFVDWLRLRQKHTEIDEARSSAAQKAADLAARRAALADSIESTKGGISELARHAKNAKPDTAPAPPARAAHTHEDAAALLNQTQLIGANQKVLSLLDRRISDQKQLADI